MQIADDRILDFICKKTERLLVAVYLVTNFLSDNEPLKWRLRECANALLADLYNISRAEAVEQSETLKLKKEYICEVSSLLNIAKAVGLVSEMNTELLSKEFESLKSIITSRIDANARANGSLSSEFLAEPNSILQSAIGQDEHEKDKKIAETSRKQNSANGPYFSEPKTNMRPETKLSSYKKQVYALYKTSRERSKIQDTQNVRLSLKDKRRATVIALLKRTNNMTIKDISISIPDCSEKTIQRELMSMIKDNIIKREGERRWSKYTLA